MTPTLQDLILRRLTSTGADQHAWSLLILAELESPDTLEGCLAGTQSLTPLKRARKTAAATKPASEPPGVYLSAITVAGFGGIGPATTLPLQPGPRPHAGGRPQRSPAPACAGKAAPRRGSWAGATCIKRRRRRCRPTCWWTATARSPPPAHGPLARNWPQAWPSNTASGPLS